MRLIRIFAAVLFCVCLSFYLWATISYNRTHDQQPPQITCADGILKLSVNSTQEDLLQGVTASDTQDGDLTGEILLSSKSIFLEPGLFEAEYVVFDSHQNFDSVVRKIQYTDYTSPRFGLTQPLVFLRGSNIRYLNYVTVNDVLDGDISDQIKVVASDVSNYTPGVYPVLLEVTNSFGDTVRVELMVTVRDNGTYNAQIGLSEYLVYLEPGEKFDPYALITAVNATDSTQLRKENVQILGTVDTQTAGFYQLLYSYREGNYLAETYLTVVVEGEVAQ